MMTDDRTKYLPDTLAKIISIIFHPLLMPVYGILIIFSAPTPIGYLPVALKRMLFIIILINNVILPLSLMPYFRYRNIITSWSIEDRKERIIPLLATSFFYSVTAYITFRYHILTPFIKAFILSAAFLAICVTIIAFWWKISIHSAGAGALISLVIILSVKMSTPLTWFLLPVILASGIVLTSRLWLNSHNPEEVWFGLLLGLIGSSLFLLFF
jgi:hypothetical protein